MACLLPGVMMRLNGDIAHEVQCLGHRKFSTMPAALVVMNLWSLNNEAADCGFKMTKWAPSNGLVD